MVKIKIRLPGKLQEIADELAQRRYGNIPDSFDKLINDAVNWRIDQWEKDGEIGFLDLLWIFLRRCPIKFIQERAWKNIAAPYFEGMELRGNK